jgi:hypothetical protein
MSCRLQFLAHRRAIEITQSHFPYMISASLRLCVRFFSTPHTGQFHGHNFLTYLQSVQRRGQDYESFVTV